MRALVHFLGMAETNPLETPFNRQTALRESPLWVGILLGWVGLWIRGNAWVIPDFPAGMGWEAYFQLANNLSDGAGSGPSNVTKPLYPWLLSVVGTPTSYNTAAAAIGALCMDIIVVAAGLIGWLLAGPWAGGLAALSVPFVDDFAQASQWANLYPLLGASTGMALVFGLATGRHGHLAWPFLAGLSAAAALATDWRGVVVIPAVVLLVLIGLWSHPRRILCVVMLVVGFGVGPAFERGVGVEVHQPWEMQLEGERLARVRGEAERDPWMGAACEGKLVGELPHPSWFVTPCARAIRQWNARFSVGHVPFGFSLTGLLGLLVLLPAGRGLRGVLNSGVVFGLGVGLLLAVASWAVLPGRYVLHFAAPLCALLPVGLAKALGLAPKLSHTRWLVPLVFVVAGGWLVWAVGPRRVSPPSSPPVFVKVMHDLEERLGPQDVLMDCAGGSVALAYLPRTLHDRPTNGSPMDGDACRKWVQRPQESEGSQWLLFGGQMNRPGERPDFDPQDAPGWVEAHRVGETKGVVEIWKWGG